METFAISEQFCLNLTLVLFFIGLSSLADIILWIKEDSEENKSSIKAAKAFFSTVVFAMSIIAASSLWMNNLN